VKDITILIAHPDDELLFLWPFLSRARRIVCMVSDQNNPERAWCKDRGKALEDIGRLIGAEVINLGGNSEFYRLSTRDEALKRFICRTERWLTHTVATHNPWGEYGHIDHIICHLAARNVSGNVLTTDIADQVNWLPVKRWQPGNLAGFSDIDMQLFSDGKAIYDSYNCWTWSRPVIERCGVYQC